MLAVCVSVRESLHPEPRTPAPLPPAPPQTPPGAVCLPLGSLSTRCIVLLPRMCMCVSVVWKGAETESYARLCVCVDVCVRVFVRKRKCAGVRAKTGGSPTGASPSGPTPQRRARERGVRAAANKSKCPWWPSSQCTAARPSCSAPELALAHTHTHSDTHPHTPTKTPTSYIHARTRALCVHGQRACTSTEGSRAVHSWRWR